MPFSSTLRSNINLYLNPVSSPLTNGRVPVDPLEWQISQDAANAIIAWFANTVGAAESVLRVAATGHDKRLFLKLETDNGLSCFYKVVAILYLLSALGRVASGATVAYTGTYDFTASYYLEGWIKFLVQYDKILNNLRFHLEISRAKLLHNLFLLVNVCVNQVSSWTGLCFFCLYFFAQSSQSLGACTSQFLGRRDFGLPMQDAF
ncbi:hypothetical protein IFM89_000189 [Coptis chinensis]|uniref:Uncharacterized protein n=1 Tax=Coptis chinensis TaxID=261450 RepID=A0A835I7Z1_9MAGN|nr:hypothetical protein IFM89_000189 [Coptis chinensis]